MELLQFYYSRSPSISIIAATGSVPRRFDNLLQQYTVPSPPRGRRTEARAGHHRGILVARHLKTTDDLFDNRSSPRTESMVAAAVQWAEGIMRKIEGVFGGAE
jgi:hypothetical protein